MKQTTDKTNFKRMLYASHIKYWMPIEKKKLEIFDRSKSIRLPKVRILDHALGRIGIFVKMQ